MAYLRQISNEEARGALKRTYDAAIARTGSVANIIRMMSLDGPAAQVAMQFYATLMKRENGLSGARKEMLATVVSYINDCYY